MADEVKGERLLRNVPNGHYDEDAQEPDPAVVWPRAEDDGHLSTDREGVWSPEKSFQFRTQTLKLASRGVISLPADELREQWEITTSAAPLEAGVAGAVADNPAHALSDFSHLVGGTPSEKRRTREALLKLAMDDGWVYRPVD